MLRHPEWIFQIDQVDEPLSAAHYSLRLRDFLNVSGGSNGVAALPLALFRRKELARIVIRDGLGATPVNIITDEISNLSDAILEQALTSVRADLEQRHGRPSDPSSINASGFAVVALGKLGGRELNYSSDIDLMFLYGENGETSGPLVTSNKEFFKKVSVKLTALLSTYTAAGVCYRVDLRLRPEGALGEICFSLEGAKSYYQNRARAWELQMLIKARVAAGDHAVGEHLLAFVRPLIYSTTLDFSTIEAMSETRERLSEKLARKRLKNKELDVKLARGGIRDIEFLAQCLQRLHGSRDSSVRQTGTLYALSSLHDSDLLSSTEHAQLAHAYKFLRTLEHRLQFESDQQTHKLPDQPIEMERVAQRMPATEGSSCAPTASAMLATLNQHLENVQVIYERIVHAQRPLHYAPNLGVAEPQPAVETNPAKNSDTIGEASLAPIENSAPTLSRMLRIRGIRRAEVAFAQFLGVLHGTPKQLSILDSSCLTAEYTARIFELSPFLAAKLSAEPELIEEVQRVASTPGARPSFERLAPPLSDLEGLRQFYSREMFRTLVASICLPEPVFQTLDRTSSLAEFLIARAYRIALEQSLAYARSHASMEKPFSDPQNQMMVVALGRLGMREFDLGSDADVLFIIQDSEALRKRFWTRVAERTIDILTSYHALGPVLTLDTRLRPNGREGLLVQTESAYVDYFANKAEAWEGIAYMKARGVAGDLERATVFLTELQQVDWRRYGQSGRSRHDLKQMRLRIEREQTSAASLKTGRGAYYDADFILMYLRLKGAGMFFKSLNTPERIDVVEKMGHLERADAEFLLHATTFFRAVDHASRLVTGKAEERLPASSPQKEMVADLVQRWTGQQVKVETLDEELLALQHNMRHLFETVFT